MHASHHSGRIRRIALASAVALAMAAAVLVTLDRRLMAEGHRPGAQGRQGDGGLVMLDFRVVDGEGAPVLGLTPGEVTLKVDGRERDIASLHLIRLAAADETAPAAPSAPSPPFGSNAVVDVGRSIFVVIDAESISPGREQPIRTALEDLLTSALPQDRIAIVDVPQGRSAVDLTADHEAARAAIGKFSGMRPGVETEEDIDCRTVRVLDTVGGLAEHIPPDQPMVLVVLSSGLADPARPTAIVIGSQSGLCPVRVEHYNNIGAAVAASRAAFFGILTPDLRTSEGAPQAEDMRGGLASLAGLAGGVSLRLGGTGSAMARAMRETTAFYRAAFAPQASERNDAAHRIEIAVSRPDVEVHARSEVRIERRPARGPSARDMLRSVVAVRDLPLRAAAYVAPSVDAGGKVQKNKVKIVVLFETQEPGATLRSAMAGLVDDEGKLVAQWTAQEDELRQPERASAAGAARTPIMAALEVKPGTYRVRVAATDGEGRGGTVDYHVRAELPESEIQMSALLLGTQQDGGFAPRLLYHDEDSAIALLEIYGELDAATASATIEMSETADGPPLASAPARISPAGGGKYVVAFGGFEITTLEPGDYVMSLTLSANGRVVGQVSRTLRKVAP